MDFDHGTARDEEFRVRSALLTCSPECLKLSAQFYSKFKERRVSNHNREIDVCIQALTSMKMFFETYGSNEKAAVGVEVAVQALEDWQTDGGVLAHGVAKAIREWARTERTPVAFHNS